MNDANKNQFVSTRDGLLHGGFQITMKDANNAPISGIEVWLAQDDQDSGAYREQLGCVELVCALDPYPECSSILSGYVYIEAVTDETGTATFHQRWGGSGALIIQVPHAFNCPTQVVYSDCLPAEGVVFKSTDMNADGKWNECDRAKFQPCMGATGQPCLNQADFNLDNVVNSADLAILQADITAGCGEDLTTCGEDLGGPLTGCDVPTVGVISDLTVDWVGPTQVGLAWTAPGAQGSSGTVAGYQVRYSTSPITNCNFNAATLAGRGPLPLPPGTPQAYTISTLQACQTYHFAVKAFTSAGLVGAVSNVPSTQTTCSKTAEVARVPQVLELDIADGNTVREGARVSYSIPSGDAGKEGRLAIFDAAGRRIRTLVSGALEQGRHVAMWNLKSDSGEPMLAGVYFARLSVGEKQLSRTLVVLAE